MLTLSAPAKINWFLGVLGKREDGYHDIVSLMQCLTLGDTLTIEGSDVLEVATEAEIPMRENLVYRAAVAMRERSGITAGARIVLKKEIPLAAGLGGGSSDAAAALMGLNNHWRLGLTRTELAEIGGSIGSDVPFFFYGPVGLIRGRGEIVQPEKITRSCTLVLAKPPEGVSAAWAYGEIDRTEGPGTQIRPEEWLTKISNNIKLFCQALERGDFPLLASLCGNDLEASVVGRYPVIGEIKHTLVQSGALFSAMSGSGPTVFGVFRTDGEAARAAERLSPHWCRVVRTLV